MNAIDLVLTFIAAARRSLALLRVDYVKVERVSGQGLVAFPRGGGEGARHGPLGDGGEFALHGVGCLFHLPTGESVDLDWDSDGVPIFDVYRLRSYARSLGREVEWTDAQLRDAADWLVSSGELSALDGDWYVITDECP